MTFFGALFYILAAVILVSTGLAVSSRTLMHAVIHLIVALLATAVLFFLLGAPLLAAFQVIVYAGAIMVLFLFIVMLIRPEEESAPRSRRTGRFAAPVVLGGVTFAAALALLFADPAGTGGRLELASASPRELSEFVFREYWLAVEMISFLLFLALAGAYYLARGSRADRARRGEEQ
jgi:NADH-quinone oxidoreductase subunit J